MKRRKRERQTKSKLDESTQAIKKITFCLFPFCSAKCTQLIVQISSYAATTNESLKIHVMFNLQIYLSKRVCGGAIPGDDVTLMSIN